MNVLLTATVLASFLFLSGCVNPFAPKLDNSPDNTASVVGDQHTIEGVFQNFRQAYLFQDTTMYGQLLAPNFIFTYRDYDKGVDVFWGRDEEMRTTYGLFQNVQRLDLVWNNIIDSTFDAGGLKGTVVRNFNLTVTFDADDIVRIDGYADLTVLRPTPNDVWTISLWRDESNF
ncbi:MAG: hypothetical protein KGJ59_10425 [Bacteroidota bacterium]|nr:hypothetical protein [Bacteroidota bacterium]